MKIIIKYIICWLGLVFIAILNGTLREKVYTSFMNELSAHQLSSIIGIFFFGIFIWFIMSIWKINSEKEALVIGLIWLIMTICFEFIFGHFVIGHPWSKLFNDYNLLAGRVWLLVLLWTTFAPYIIYKLKKRDNK